MASITFLSIPTWYISFFLSGESLSRKQLLSNCSYPTEYYCALALVCNAVCKLSIFQWFERCPISFCILVMWANAVFSFCLTKMSLPQQWLWQKSDTTTFLSAIRYYYWNFRKSCWRYFLLSLLQFCGSQHHNSAHSGSPVFQEVVCCTGFSWQGFGSRRATGVASVRNF